MTVLFIEEASTAFMPLVTAYGFEPPEHEIIAHEVFVRFHRGNHTVSISRAPGQMPLVELFSPAAETGDDPVAWGTRAGVERSRRIPRLTVEIAYDDESPCAHLQAAATEFFALEADWLAGSP